MVDTALVWILLATVVSGVAVVAFARRYARASDVDYAMFAAAVLFGGYGVELGMANGYLPENRLSNGIVGVCVVVAVVAGAIGIRRRGRGFGIRRDDAR